MDLLLLLSVAGLAAGALAGWLWGRRRLPSLQVALATARAEAQAHAHERERLAGDAAEAQSLRVELAGERRAAQERTEAEARAREERERWFAEQTRTLADRFGQLSDQALERAQGRLVQQADETLKLHRSKADSLLAPLREQLLRYETGLKRIEDERRKSEGGLEALLKQLAEEVPRSRAATQTLATALRSSGKVVGRWGEEQCRNVLEQAGLVEGVDFDPQVHQTSEAGRQLPDFVIRLPGDRRLVIDVKCSIDAYLAADEAVDEDERRRYLAEHAQRLRGHAMALAKKDYSAALGDTSADFVVMFVAGEHFLAAALAVDRKLLNDAFEKKVVPAGPINLIAVARTVASMRNLEKQQHEARDIARAGTELYAALRTMAGHFTGTGKALDNAVKRFNEMVGSFDARVMPAARRMAEHGALQRCGSQGELAPPAAIDLAPRETRHALQDSHAPAEGDTG